MCLLNAGLRVGGVEEAWGWQTVCSSKHKVLGLKYQYHQKKKKNAWRQEAWTVWYKVLFLENVSLRVSWCESSPSLITHVHSVHMKGIKNCTFLLCAAYYRSHYTPNTSSSLSSHSSYTRASNYTLYSQISMFWIAIWGIQDSDLTRRCEKKNHWTWLKVCC
jgi:hypothetical protein